MTVTPQPSALGEGLYGHLQVFDPGPHRARMRQRLYVRAPHLFWEFLPFDAAGTCAPVFGRVGRALLAGSNLLTSDEI
jgi:hypothetical protein